MRLRDAAAQSEHSQLRNLEGTDSEGKGSITASALEVDAHTDGIINNFALAGVASKSSNVNKDAGGVSTSTSDGKAAQCRWLPPAAAFWPHLS